MTSDAQQGPVQSWSLTHVGHVRSVNEDAVLDMPGAGLWAVADGMGGHARGDVASQSTVRALYDLGRSCVGPDLVGQVPRAVHSVNSQLIAQAQAMGPGQIIGTTLVALVLEDENYHCFWAGDSRIYLWRDGELTPLTQDHAESAAGRGNVLTRAVGASEHLDLDYTRGLIYEGDTFLLCSDGLTKVIDDDGLAYFLETTSPVDGCQRLVDQALERGGPDNVSCVLVHIS